MSLRTLREIEQGRVRAPRAGSLQRLAEVLREPRLSTHADVTAHPGAANADHPLVLRILGRLSAHRGRAELGTGTPKQRTLLALMALRANHVVERDEIIEVLWGDDLPDSFGQLIHTYVSRIRLMLNAQAGSTVGQLSVQRCGPGYELHVDNEGRLDVLEFRRLTREAAHALAGNDPIAEQAALSRSLMLWHGQLLEGMPARLQGHPVAVECSRQRVASALRLADLALSRGQHEEVVRQLERIARHDAMHEGLHARLVTALAGSGRRSEALELFAAIDRRLRKESGIEPGTELRAAQMSVLRAGGMPRREEAMRECLAGRAGAALHQGPSTGDFVGRVEHHRIVQYLTTCGAQEMFGTAPIAALHGPPGAGKSVLTARVAASARRSFPGGVLYAQMNGGEPDEVSAVLGRFLNALDVPGDAISDDPAERVTMYRTLLAKRRLLVVIDDAASEQSVRPLIPVDAGCAALISSRTPLSGLEGAKHFRVGPFTVSEAIALLVRTAGRSRILAELDAAQRLAELCGRLPLAVRIAGMRLAARPHWTVAQLVDRLEDEEHRLSELIVGDLAVRARLQPSYAALDPEMRRAMRALAGGLPDSFSVTSAAALLGWSVRETEDLLDGLIDRQLVEGPAQASGDYRFLPLTQIHARWEPEA